MVSGRASSLQRCHPEASPGVWGRGTANSGAGGAPTAAQTRYRNSHLVSKIQVDHAHKRSQVKMQRETGLCAGRDPEHVALPLRAWWRLPHALASTGPPILFAGTPPCFPACASLGTAHGTHGHSRAPRGYTVTMTTARQTTVKGPGKGQVLSLGSRGGWGVLGGLWKGPLSPVGTGPLRPPPWAARLTERPCKQWPPALSRRAKVGQSLHGPLCSVPSAEPVIW